MIAILDYGVGNLKSLKNMVKKVGFEAVITSDIEVIKNADKFILPGIGAFDHGIKSLRKARFFDTLEDQVLVKKKTVLGICLGMQLLAKRSEEGRESGLGWIDAEVIRFNLPKEKYPIPHMGWNAVHPRHCDSLFRNLNNSARFYFVHSYYVVCNDDADILGETTYGIKFTCSLNRGNIFGMQFHPEKSHKYGMQVFRNFEAI